MRTPAPNFGDAGFFTSGCELAGDEHESACTTTRTRRLHITRKLRLDGLGPRFPRGFVLTCPRAVCRFKRDEELAAEAVSHKDSALGQGASSGSSTRSHQDQKSEAQEAGCDYGARQ